QYHGGRERHGPGAVHHLRDRQIARRHDLGHEPPRRRCYVPPPLAPGLRRESGDLPAMTASHVLVVDDDPALLQGLPEALRLRMSGVTVDTADSAAPALERTAGR